MPYSAMSTHPTNVLLIEDQPEDAKRILEALTGNQDKAYLFHVEWLTRLTESLERLKRNGNDTLAIDVILLDLELSSAGSIEALDQVIKAAPEALIFVLGRSTDDASAHLAIQHGARGHIAKDHIDIYWLPRTLLFFIHTKTDERLLHAQEEALFDERERAQVTLNSIGDGVLATDSLGRVTYLNPVSEAMTGWSCEKAMGQPLLNVFRIIDSVTRQPSENPAVRAMQENRTIGLCANCVLIRRDGFECAIEDSVAPIHNRAGQVAGAVIVFRDVSQSRIMTTKMAYLAQHDVLTGLANRLLLSEHFAFAIGQAQRHNKQVALLFLDLDNFKHINDSLGHITGDKLLKSVSERLVRGVRATDTVCRQGGDEFVILLSEIEQPQAAAQIAESLCATLALPHRIDGRDLHVTSSIGISIYPDDGSTVDSLMQSADTAMYHAKAIGRNNVQFFRADMNTQAMQRLLTEGGLRRALIQGEFRLYYQPKIDLVSGTMVGAEALIRWHDPDLGLVLPAHFIGVAEECGLILPIGRWVLREACRQIKSWLDSGLCAVPVSVNISAIELRHKNFLSGVAAILRETGLAPHYIEMELTESILMHDAESSAKVLTSLKAMGVRLAIDDFGIGYSSLSYLKRFPIDTLKIDQSFVQDIGTDDEDTTIVRAVISLGQNLKQRVVAEGVETLEQLDFLRLNLCDQGQGFKFSYPLPSGDFARLLANLGTFIP